MIRIRAERSLIWQNIAIHVIRDNLNERPITVEALVHSGSLADDTFYFRQIEEGTLSPSPSFKLDTRAAQSLMDDLYRAGLRPTDAQGSAGQLEAVQAHLADMKRAYDVVLAGAR